VPPPDLHLTYWSTDNAYAKNAIGSGLTAIAAAGAWNARQLDLRGNSLVYPAELRAIRASCLRGHKPRWGGFKLRIDLLPQTSQQYAFFGLDASTASAANNPLTYNSSARVGFCIVNDVIYFVSNNTGGLVFSAPTQLAYNASATYRAELLAAPNDSVVHLAVEILGTPSTRKTFDLGTLLPAANLMLCPRIWAYRSATQYTLFSVKTFDLWNSAVPS
jgi:hypothetical protein